MGNSEKVTTIDSARARLRARHEARDFERFREELANDIRALGGGNGLKDAANKLLDALGEPLID